jgi:hypothetical protein
LLRVSAGVAIAPPKQSRVLVSRMSPGCKGATDGPAPKTDFTFSMVARYVTILPGGGSACADAGSVAGAWAIAVGQIDEAAVSINNHAFNRIGTGVYHPSLMRGSVVMRLPAGPVVRHRHM